MEARRGHAPKPITYTLHTRYYLHDPVECPFFCNNL